MKWKLRKLMDEVTWKTGTRCTYERLREATGGDNGGVSITALHKMANGESKRVDVATLERLLDYFSSQLARELTTEDILAYREEEGE